MAQCWSRRVAIANERDPGIVDDFGELVGDRSLAYKGFDAGSIQGVEREWDLESMGGSEPTAEET